MTHENQEEKNEVAKKLGRYVRTSIEAMQATGEYETLSAEAAKEGETLSVFEKYLIQHALVYNEANQEVVEEINNVQPIVIDELKSMQSNRRLK